MNEEPRTIPLAKLNCLHCGEFQENECTRGILERGVDPSTYYCMHIFRNYKEEGQEVTDDHLRTD